MARWIITGWVFFRMLVDVEGTEALRQVEVDLRRAALPFTADGVLERIFELGTVECALTRQNAGLDASFGLCLDRLQHVHHHAFSAIPERVGAHALLRAGRKLDDNLLEAEILIDRQDEIVDLQAFGGHLLVGAEDVRIVLREAAYAHQTMQRARGLVTMDSTEFRKTDRQFAIGLQTMLEDLDMARAVHRLQCEDAIVIGIIARDGDLEHVVTVPAPVTRGLPQ